MDQGPRLMIYADFSSTHNHVGVEGLGFIGFKV